MKSQASHIQEYASFAKDDVFQLMLNNISESFVFLDKNLSIVESNKTARDWSLRTVGKPLFPGLNFMELVDADDAPHLKDILTEVLKGAERKTELARLLPDFTTTYLENSMFPARNDQGIIVGIIIHSKDITEKKKAESAIKEAEERWQFAFDVSNQAAWDWNMETNKVIYSSSYKKIYGFADSDLANDCKEWEARIHPEDKSRTELELQRHIQSETPVYEATYRIRLNNGEHKWILARGKLVSKDANGKPLRMIGTHTDLTQALRAEEEIKKMNERFIYASKAASQALWEWDAITGLAYVSPSFTEIFGWEADENNYFEQWHQYIHPEDKKATISGYYETLKKTTSSIWEAEYRFLKRDGSYAVVADKAYILRNKEGEVVKVIGATQDISAQKQTEEELSKSNERYNLMLQATNELLWEWDMNTLEVYRSGKNFKKVYGLNDYSLVKTHEQWLNRIHPEDREKVEKSIEKVFLARSDKQTFEMEYRFLNGDGGYNYLQGRGMLLTDENGKPVRMIGTEQNISERKRLEQELLKNELEYTKLINQATVDSQEQERSEIGRELHDNINQVLTTTKLYLELALANEDMMKELVKKSSRNISSLINEIRELSRSLMDPTIGDLGIVDSINDLIENINMTRKIHVDLEIDDSIENLLDRNQKLTIFRIIQESLNNVIRHAKAKLVTISISVQNENVRLTIADDGIGFSNDSIKKGAGLKNITNRVYLINGSFRIDSKPGHGCQIKITFPINNQQS